MLWHLCIECIAPTPYAWANSCSRHHLCVLLSQCSCLYTGMCIIITTTSTKCFSSLLFWTNWSHVSLLSMSIYCFHSNWLVHKSATLHVILRTWSGKCKYFVNGHVSKYECIFINTTVTRFWKLKYHKIQLEKFHGCLSLISNH